MVTLAKGGRVLGGGGLRTLHCLIKFLLVDVAGVIDVERREQELHVFQHLFGDLGGTSGDLRATPGVLAQKDPLPIVGPEVMLTVEGAIVVPDRVVHLQAQPIPFPACGTWKGTGALAKFLAHVVSSNGGAGGEGERTVQRTLEPDVAGVLAIEPDLVPRR